MLCLDTNIIIFALNQRRPGVRERLKAEQAAGSAMMIPAIVLFELSYGIAKSTRPDRNRMVLDGFLSGDFLKPEFDSEHALEAGSIRAMLQRNGTPIGAYDILIAAQARRRHAILVPASRREFDRVPGLLVTDWAS